MQYVALVIKSNKYSLSASECCIGKEMCALATFAQFIGNMAVQSVMNWLRTNYGKKRVCSDKNIAIILLKW